MASNHSIFVSYRRADTPSSAGRLADWLMKAFGEPQVFMDVDALKPGVDFRAEIARSVGACQVLIAVIGPRWATVTDDTGRRRLDDPDDIVIFEIGAALKKGVTVVPVLTDDAKMPTDSELPTDVRALAGLQASKLRHESFRSDVPALVTRLREIIAAPLTAAEDAGGRPRGPAGPSRAPQPDRPAVPPNVGGDDEISSHSGPTHRESQRAGTSRLPRPQLDRPPPVTAAGSPNSGE